jgi:predicted DNA-binding ribbon-helix-helix protein
LLARAKRAVRNSIDGKSHLRKYSRHFKIYSSFVVLALNDMSELSLRSSKGSRIPCPKMQQGRPLNTSSVKKRSVVFGNRTTSISLENEFWEAINQIAQLKKMSLNNIVGLIADSRRQPNLSSAVRVFVLEYYRSRPASP